MTGNRNRPASVRFLALVARVPRALVDPAADTAASTVPFAEPAAMVAAFRYALIVAMSGARASTAVSPDAPPPKWRAA